MMTPVCCLTVDFRRQRPAIQQHGNKDGDPRFVACGITWPAVRSATNSPGPTRQCSRTALAKNEGNRPPETRRPDGSACTSQNRIKRHSHDRLIVPMLDHVADEMRMVMPTREQPDSFRCRTLLGIPTRHLVWVQVMDQILRSIAGWTVDTGIIENNACRTRRGFDETVPATSFCGLRIHLAVRHPICGARPSGSFNGVTSTLTCRRRGPNRTKATPERR